MVVARPSQRPNGCVNDLLSLALILLVGAILVGAAWLLDRHGR